MKKYLTQLIADMRRAAKNLPAKPYYDIPPEAEGIEYVIEWENARSKPMHEWFGIAKENFPPPEKLTEKELTLIVKEILKLWEAYNFEPALPDDLPADAAYKVLIDYFDKPVAWVSEGILHIEFCDYDPENCPFPREFCWCRKFEDETDDADMDLSFNNSAEIAILDEEIKAIKAMDRDEFLPEKSMERYVEQLIGDMRAAARSFLQPDAIPGTAEARGAEDSRQLMEKPFVTLEELTGIDADKLPEHIVMDGLQTRKVLRAMLHLLDTCLLKVYFPKVTPHEMKYEALREYWDVYQIKYLPLSGDEIDLCTGDPMTCPYGEFCDCGEEFDEYELPEKFASCINRIAQSIDKGFICYLNPETMEMEDVPKSLMDNPHGFNKATGFSLENGKLKHESWNECYTFEPLDSRESFKIMEAFTKNIDDEILQEELFYALNHKKPFANFERVIDNRGQSNHWFFFKMEWLEDHVKQIIHDRIYKIGNNEDIDDNELPF